ncbi:hypothetical protein ABE936_13555 [Enterococcus gallinarum]|uniref:hypothetical protein n=1 Tax=Enterococcus gallinarum TaxID=1353 RepID=UPI003D6BD906
MDRSAIFRALENGEFDGISHEYEPRKGYSKNEVFQTKMVVKGSCIEVTTEYKNKFFDNKENVSNEHNNVKVLTGNSAVDFIVRRPFYFKKVRPELFLE